MKTPEEFAQEVMRTAYNATFYGERARGLIAAPVAARDAEVRAAALEEAAVVAKRTARYSKADAEVCDEIAAAIIALAAPASTPKPPESADGEHIDFTPEEQAAAGYSSLSGSGWTSCRLCGKVKPDGGWKTKCKGQTGISLRASPPKGEAPKVKCGTCGGDGYYKGPRLGDEPCPTCNGTGDAP